MDFRRKINWTSVALVVVLAIGMPWTAGAQGQRGGAAEPYTPAANAKDLKAVLFNWMWGMGMLKGHDERDMVASLEYQGSPIFLAASAWNFRLGSLILPTLKTRSTECLWQRPGRGCALS